MSKIRHIIFDFGGVLLNLDYEVSWSILKQVLQVEDLKASGFFQIYERYEVGAFPEEEFIQKVKRISHVPTSDQDIIDAVNAMLGDLPRHRIQMLDRLQDRYILHLLSNTNQTHIHYVYNYLADNYGIKDFGAAYFTTHHFSHIVHMRKPNQNIYESVLQLIDTHPRNVLFIDDSIDNVVAAKSCGISAVLHNPLDDITDMIDSYIELGEGS